MPLFRFHRGGLQDSIDTTIIVKDLYDLHRTCQPFVNEMFWMKAPDDFTLEISPYPSADDCFDRRIGWYTHIVLLNINNPCNPHIKNINAVPIGFLSENINE